jgi:hypothetical protein
MAPRDIGKIEISLPVPGHAFGELVVAGDHFPDGFLGKDQVCGRQSDREEEERASESGEHRGKKPFAARKGIAFFPGAGAAGKVRLTPWP